MTIRIPNATISLEAAAARLQKMISDGALPASKGQPLHHYFDRYYKNEKDLYRKLSLLGLVEPVPKTDMTQIYIDAAQQALDNAAETYNKVMDDIINTMLAGITATSTAGYALPVKYHLKSFLMKPESAEMFRNYTRCSHELDMAKRDLEKRKTRTDPIWSSEDMIRVTQAAVDLLATSKVTVGLKLADD